MLPTDAFITIQDLSFYRGERCIFDHIDLIVPRGKITAVMGPSGSGKTTLLRLIAAQLPPDTGTVLLNDENIHELSREKLYHCRRKMGMLFQSGALFTNLSTYENVAFPIREHTALPEDIIRDIVFLKLEAVGLRGAHHLMPNELSGGMARRVALARAIALDPELIMYDEPFAGQDPIAMGVVLSLVKTLNQALGMTTILVSHDVHEVLAIADLVYIISGGKVITQGSPKALQQSEQPDVKQFIHGYPDGTVPFHYPAEDIRQAFFGECDDD